MSSDRRRWLEDEPLLPWEGIPGGVVRQNGPVADENATRREVLLVDRRGLPILVREPRPVGFRRP